MTATTHIQINGKPLSLPQALALALQLAQQGQAAAALQVAEAARGIAPDSADAAYVHALALNAAGRPQEAERMCAFLLAGSPAHAGAHALMGGLTLRAGMPDRAVHHLERLLQDGAAEPALRLALADALLGCGFADRAEAVLNACDGVPDEAMQERRGEVHRLKQAAAARAACLEAVQTARLAADFERMASVSSAWLADHADDAVMRAQLAYGLLLGERLDEARAAIEQALAQAPAWPEVLCVQARVLLRQGASGEALIAAQRACTLAPERTDALLAWAAALAAGNQLEAALQPCAAAVARLPQAWYAHAQMAAILTRMGALEQAADAYLKAIALRPGFFEAMSNLGNILRRLGRYEAAALQYRKALALRPGAALVHANLGNIEKEFGRYAEAIACYRNALRLEPGLAMAWSNLLFCSHYCALFSRAEQFDLYRQFGVRFGGQDDLAQPRPLAPDARLRVGFVSGDLHDHPVGFFLESMLPRLAGGVELYAYANQDRRSALTERILPLFKAWRWVRGLDDARLANTIREDGIDVLIDLSGHSADNRLPVFARRPAPVQATWLGYFATTGLPEMDYIIADRWVLPEDEARWFTEIPQRLPDSYLCLSPPALALSPNGLPALSGRQGVTFGSFNNLSKLNERVIRGWARLLNEVEGSRLLLKTLQLGNAAVCEDLRRRFREAGLEDGRLLLEGPSERAELLRSYHKVDIALDPYPYPGGTTTVEALWMGVPVLTLCGDAFLGRVGVSILRTAGLDDWIADSERDYIERARQWAADLPALADLRSRLRAQLLASPLCDAERFARHFEHALRAMCAARS